MVGVEGKYKKKNPYLYMTKNYKQWKKKFYVYAGVFYYLENVLLLQYETKVKFLIDKMLLNT
jgi:hypothetical protein